MGTAATIDDPVTSAADRAVDDDDQPECLACYLERTLPEEGCDRDLRLTHVWHGIRGRRTPVRWLAEHGGRCDCEVSYNVLGTVERSARHRELQCEDSYARLVGPAQGPFARDFDSPW